MGREKCVVLIPVSGSLESEVDDGVRELSVSGYAVRFLRGASDISLARSVMATEAMRDKFEETFWIDSDVVFSPDDVDRIRSLDLPLTAGLYMRKGRPEFAATFAEGFTGATFGVGGGLVEMKYVGMGFTHVRREVYEAVGDRLPTVGGGYDGKTFVPYFLPLLVPDNGLCYLSEDAAFCYRARQAGFDVVADTRVRLGHVGRHKYTWDDFAPRQSYETLQLGT